MFTKKERLIDPLGDKRRLRRKFRQYDKLKFTEPLYFCPLSNIRLKKLARSLGR
ncbi:MULTISPECIES: hypothetical protein [Gammaproteobacteria]|uniref:hypothetical protein n=1 Tax=Gammaproteobacteria TaxID=1236 RepID=UPI002FC90681